jgi:ABC-type polysaccharide/polyol phosphate export permease
MIISLGLVIVLMLFFKVPFHFTMLWWLLIIPVLFVVTFGISTILLHFGIFVEDLFNVTNIVLKLMFYISGVFYSIGSRLSGATAGILLKLNPIAFIMDQCRNVMIYNKIPDFGWLAIWFVVGCLLSWIGVVVIHKYENSYAKVI